MKCETLQANRVDYRNVRCTFQVPDDNCSVFGARHDELSIGGHSDVDDFSFVPHWKVKLPCDRVSSPIFLFANFEYPDSVAICQSSNECPADKGENEQENITTWTSN